MATGNSKKKQAAHLFCSCLLPAWPKSRSPYSSAPLAIETFKIGLSFAMKMQFLSFSCFPQPPLSKFSNLGSQFASQASVASSPAGLLCIHSFATPQAAPLTRAIANELSRLQKIDTYLWRLPEPSSLTFVSLHVLQVYKTDTWWPVWLPPTPIEAPTDTQAPNHSPPATS